MSFPQEIFQNNGIMNPLFWNYGFLELWFFGIMKLNCEFAMHIQYNEEYYSHEQNE